MSQENIFAVGDIHGCAKELKILISILPLDLNSTIIFLGDYVDRGPNSKEVIQTIIDLQKSYHVIALLGNHEDMMMEFFKDPSSPLAGFFILNGGSATLASYVTHGNHYEIPDEHMHFLNSLKLFHETENHFFVHAGVPNIALNQISESTHHNELLWIRQQFLNSQFKWKKIVVHGHTPAPEVEITSQRINLDTGCVFNGSLSAMNVVSGEIYQVKAEENIPHTFLRADPEIERIAKRFMGAIPVYVQTEDGYDEFLTINYNEFGLLIVDTTGEDRIFEVGQILEGKIGSLSSAQIDFVGQVMRHQRRGSDIAYGIKIVTPLGQSSF